MNTIPGYILVRAPKQPQYEKDGITIIKLIGEDKYSYFQIPNTAVQILIQTSLENIACYKVIVKPTFLQKLKGIEADEIYHYPIEESILYN